MVLNVKRMDSVKKEKEWLVMQYFREKYAGFPKGKLSKSESPDFIIKHGRKKRIGVELTQLDFCHKDGQENGSKQLSDLLNRKEDKLRIYRKKWLNEYWLLITIENIDSIDTGLNNIHLDSKFAKVFLFDLVSGQISK